MTDITTPEQVHSFVLRQGRLTKRQQAALQDLSQQYLLALPEQLFDLTEVFGCDAACTLEIGFGNGDALLQQAQAKPEQNFIGIEVHKPGVGKLLADCHAAGVGNVRVFHADAIAVLQQAIPDASLAKICLFFPDPWPKRRHGKRRFLQAATLPLLQAKLKPGGLFHMATDWEDYAKQALGLLELQPGLLNVAGAGCFHPDRAGRPLTRFEARGLRLGHPIWDLLFANQGLLDDDLG